MTTNLSKHDIDTFLKPEIRNRIDEPIYFNELNTDIIKKIVNMRIRDTINILSEKGITCTVDETVNEYILKNGFDPEFGARPIKRIIHQKILSKLSKFIINNPGIKFVKVIFNGKIKIQKQELEKNSSQVAA